ncbi:MAG: hypothetical protein JWM68_1121 [Verrucomicrobiales bacterium]|nr:hypothetical protein [Verrucomicrobiales bacterium]
MKNYQTKLLPLVTLTLVCGLGAISSIHAEDLGEVSAAARAQTQAQTQPKIENERKKAEDQAKQGLDKDAIAAIEETQKAIKAVAEGKTNEAIAAIERATGKIDVLTTRNPATALLPIEVEVEIIDTALPNLAAIRQRAKAAEYAVGEKDYPTARLLLQGLASEIRLRSHHLPLATYPTAMKNAARLLDEKKSKEASAVLLVALNTLVIIDRVTPLPLALAQTAINDAQSKREKDKDGAQKLLAYAKYEVERAKELGYAGKDSEYASLNKSISELEKQLKGNENTASAFTRLKEKVAAFFKRQSESEKKLAAGQQPANF